MRISEIVFEGVFNDTMAAAGDQALDFSDTSGPQGFEKFENLSGQLESAS